MQPSERRFIFLRFRDQKTLALIVGVAFLGLWAVSNFNAQKSVADPADELIRYRFQVDLNQADVVELQQLPGIGPKLAEAIIQYRTNYGPFDKPGEIIKVKGIGRKKEAALSPYLRVRNDR